MTQDAKLQVLLIEHDAGPDCRWVAQCLQYDVSAAGATLEDVLYAFERAVVGHIAAANELGLQPFSTMPPAAGYFWNLWRQSRRLDVELDPSFRIEDGGTLGLQPPDMRFVTAPAAA